jgi:uncharacterized protein (TIGR03435 family)
VLQVKQILTAAGWIAFSVITASSQVPTIAPDFEAASVKPADAQDGPPSFLPVSVAATMGFAGGPGTSDPGRIRYLGATLQMLLARAYKVPLDQISGPAWLGAERYTVEATLSPGTDADQLHVMLQELLKQRFLITLHREVKVIPVYRLKVAKNGPRLQPPGTLPQYEDDDQRKEAMKSQALDRLDKMIADMKNGIRTPNTHSTDILRATTKTFAEWLSGNVDRPVRDMTQLGGEYRFEFKWTADSAMQDDPGTSIFTAIQDQLGLKLEAGTEPIDMLVIDTAEKTPISN